jgi:hypothetical protein
LVGWWPAEGTAQDIAAQNNGIFANGPAYAAGEVGLAFSFDGNANNVTVPASPSLDVGTNQGFTIEGWVNPYDGAGACPVAEWDPNGNPSGYGVHFYVNAGAPGGIYANLIGLDGSSHTIQSGANIITNNGFQHVALTYDKATGTARLFLNGAVAEESVLGTFTAQTNGKFYIGYRPNTIPFGPFYFKGLMDELSLYSRALVVSEIQSIFNAGTAGKCSSGFPPSIVQQPANQTVTAGGKASFLVLAGGSQPLSFQWQFNGAPIDGATSSSLLLTNVQLSQAGPYAVIVTNSAGTIVSSNALLTVTPALPPSIVQQPTNQTVTAGGNASFLVLAGGTSPLSFQWQFNGVPIDGATSSPLFLTNVQASQAGAYAVIVTNSAGTVVSSNALLIVMPPPPCAPPPLGLVSLWSGGGSVGDSVARWVQTTVHSKGEKPMPRERWGLRSALAAMLIMS